MKKTIITLVLLLFVYLSSAAAWWSFPAAVSTHDSLTTSAEGLLNASEYPDVVTKYGANLIEWTAGGTNDVRAHNPDSETLTDLNSYLNDGPIADWWDRAKREYKGLNFNSGDWSAFYYIALMAHLTEDQAVPAHAYNIRHGQVLVDMDNFEELVYTNYNPDAVGLVPSATPDSNYYDLIAYTLNATLAGNDQSYWYQYWIANVPNNVNGTDYDGIYGGADGTDVFPTWWITAGANEQDLTRLLLGTAVGYTAGALASISESLPPALGNLEILDADGGKAINFSVQENRTQGVEISLKVQETGQIIKTTDGTAWDSAAQNLTTSGDASQLPWAGNFSLTWKGEVSSGECLDGNYTLELTATDGDLNTSNTSTAAVSITAPVDITRDLVNVQNTVAYPGGSIGPFTVTETNNTGCATSYNVIPYVITPSGTTYTMPTIQASLAANESRTHEHSLAVPDIAEAGYTIFGVIVTDANGNQIDADTSGFTILAAPEVPQKVSLTSKTAGKKALKRKVLKGKKATSRTWRYVALNK